jgi:hypothetical protein
MSDRPVVLDVWEIGVDPCRLCDRKAVAASAWVGGEKPRLGLGKGPEMVLACPEHSAELEIPVEQFHRSCYMGDRRESGQMVPCGAAATHVLLIGLYERRGPEPGFLAACPQHAKPPEEAA